MAQELQVNSEGPKSIRALDDDNKRKLYEQIRGIEHIEAEIADLREDCNEQKKLLTDEWSIESDVLAFVLKRRKAAAKGRCLDTFDDTITIIEEAIKEIEDRRRLRVVESDGDAIPE